MLECLERHFIETDPKTVIEFLKQLLSVPRFGIVKLFMDNYEKKSKWFFFLSSVFISRFCFNAYKGLDKRAAFY